MNQDQKWTLASGTVVEDAIAQFVSKAEQYLPLLGSFILNVDDNELMEGVFQNLQCDIEEVRRSARFTLGKEASDVAQAIDALDNAEDDELFSRLEKLSKNDHLDRNIRIWLRGAVERWWHLCDKQRMRDNRSESWWTVHLWSSILDQLLDIIKDGSFDRYANDLFELLSY